MAADVVMPRLSDSMEEGTVLRWLKSVGDEVKRGDELVEIETDKANMTYEATDEGTLVEILADEGATLPIGEPIARIGDPSEASGDGRPAKKEPEQKAEPEPRAASRRRNRRTSGAPAAGTVRERSREGVAGRPPHGTRPQRAARVDPGLGPGRPHREGRRRSGRRRRHPLLRLPSACRCTVAAARARARHGQGRGAGRRARRACSRPSRGAWRSRRRPCRTSTSRWRST